MGLRMVLDLSRSRRIHILYLLSYIFAVSTCVVAGLRIQRLFAADFNDKVSNTLEIRTFGQPGNVYLQSRFPGLFLSIGVPEGTTFLRLYGLRQTSGSLFGVCLDCGGTYTLVDGSSAVSQSASDLLPSCIFSLSVDKTTVGPLELYNVPKNRSNSTTVLAFSYVEFFLQTQANAQIQPCECHLNAATLHKLQPRQNPPTNATSPTDRSDWKNHTSSQMNVMIGLLSTLVTMVVLACILAAYYLFRRRLDHFHQMLDNLPNNEEATLDTSSSDKTPSLRGHLSRKPLPEHDPKDSRFTASSFSTHAELDSTKESHLRTVPSGSTLVNGVSPLSSVSRQKRRLEPPKFAPPTQALPIPNEPTYPEKSNTQERRNYAQSGTVKYFLSSVQTVSEERLPSSNPQQVGLQTDDNTAASTIPVETPRPPQPPPKIHQISISAPSSLPANAPNVRHLTSRTRPLDPKILAEEATPMETLKSSHLTSKVHQISKSAPPSLPPNIPISRHPDLSASRLRPPELPSSTPTIPEEAVVLSYDRKHSRQSSITPTKQPTATISRSRRKRNDFSHYQIVRGKDKTIPEQRLKPAASFSKENTSAPNRNMLSEIPRAPHLSVEIPNDLSLYPLPPELPRASTFVQPLNLSTHKKSIPSSHNPSIGVLSTKVDLPPPSLPPKSEPDNVADSLLEDVATSITPSRRRELPKLPSLP